MSTLVVCAVCFGALYCVVAYVFAYFESYFAIGPEMDAAIHV